VDGRRDTILTCLIVTSLVLLACVVSGLVIQLGLWAGPAQPALPPTKATGPAPTGDTSRQRLPAVTPTATVTAVPSATVTPSAAATAVVVPSATVTPTTAAAAERAAVDGKPDGLSVTTEELLSGIEVPARDRLDLARRFRLSEAPIPAVVNAVAPTYTVGAQGSFCVLESDALRHFQAQATLRYVGDDSYWWLQDGYSVSDADVAASAGVFESKIYPTNRDFFGTEWTPGVDNDPRIHIFVGNVPGVSGYFYSVNEYSRLINPCSNEKEMFYINVNAVRPGTAELDSTLAHEFQHMIHWYHDANEETWVNEGLSDLAMQLNGYQANDGGYSFTQSPDTQLTAWADLPQDTYPHYGASYLFMSYFLQRFGEAVMRQVVAMPENGAAGFDAVLTAAHQPTRFDDAFGDWVVANYLDDPTLDNGEWGYRDMDPQPVRVEAEYGSYPVDSQSDVRQYATDYLVFAGDGDLTLDFEGNTRVKIAPNDPHSGAHQWWSNRGDDSDMMMTRLFDLSGTPAATLEFWVWYDIEQGWDFAFVEVSTDEGDSWKILPGLYTTTENPSGNSFGHAWTGVSGGGDAPQWVQERVDLTPYVGQRVQIRFEYVTDDAVNHVGLMLDDMTIPEIGYSYDAEAGDGGWVAQGFARVDNVLRQRYLVQVIETGDVTQVRRMSLDQANRGQIVIEDLGGASKKVVLAISGLTPFTTEAAPYHLRAGLVAPDEAAR
jgi:immune inhibitor A